MPAWSADQLRPIVREILRGLLPTPQNSPAPFTCHQAKTSSPAIVSANDVMSARHSGELSVAADAVLTPLAQDAAERFGVKILVAPQQPPSRALASIAVTAPERLERADDADDDEEEGDEAERPGQRAFKAVHATVVFASDHGGFALKAELMAHVRSQGLAVLDCGAYSRERCDYPDFALAAAEQVALGQAPCAIVIDGAGIGSCMAANKVPGVLAATVHNIGTAKNSREHNGANVLCLGSRQIDPKTAVKIVDAWLETPFGGHRHLTRVNKIKAIEQAFLK